MLASQSSERRARLLVTFVCILMLSGAAAAAPLTNRPPPDRKMGRIATSQTLDPLQRELAYKVLPNVQIYVDAWVEYYPSSCIEISPGAWTVPTLPTKGVPATRRTTGFLANGDCPGTSFIFDTIFYTWQSTAKDATTDFFAATWTSPDFTVNDTVNITLALVTIQSADLFNNRVAITIDGPAGTQAPLTVSVKGDKIYTLNYNDGSPVGSGQYSVALKRPDMKRGYYYSIVAAWNASTPPVRGTFTLPTRWDVLGITENTQYIKVYESECRGTATSNKYWTFNRNTCVFAAADFRDWFGKQTWTNGSGQRIGGGLVHSNRDLYCSDRYPEGADDKHVFFTISSITGACNQGLLDGDVAVWPSPKARTAYTCGDRLLYVDIDTAENASFPHSAKDRCPACRTIDPECPSCEDHVDNYIDENTCGAISLDNYWEANLGQAGTDLRISVSEPVTGFAKPEQASYRDSEITVEARKGDDGLVVSITGGRRQVDVPLSFQVLKVKAIRRYTDRLVVIGDTGGSESLVTVINVNSGTVSDSFWAYVPVISPNGRFIAFVKDFPPHSDAETEDHEMIYDLAKTGLQNRPAGIGLGNETEVGVNVYPGNGNRRGDNIGVSEELAHQSASPLFWSPDSTKLVFADQAQGLKLVLVNVSGWGTGTVASASIMPLDRTSVCAAPLPGVPCEAYMYQVKFEDEGVQAFFRGRRSKGSIERELLVKYTDFVSSR